jgi:hypothetical protein
MAPDGQGVGCSNFRAGERNAAVNCDSDSDWIITRPIDKQFPELSLHILPLTLRGGNSLQYSMAT